MIFLAGTSRTAKAEKIIYNFGGSRLFSFFYENGKNPSVMFRLWTGIDSWNFRPRLKKDPSRPSRPRLKNSFSRPRLV